MRAARLAATFLDNAVAGGRRPFGREERMNGKAAGLAIAAAVVAALAPAAAARGGERVDVELVLAVDVSGSVDAAELALQRTGLAAAFRDPELADAVAALPRGVAAALVAWAGVPDTVVGWRRLTDRASATDFAARIEAALPVAFGRGGNTALGDALARSLAELAGNSFDGQAKIDVSGDGRSNSGAQPGPVRDAAVRAGVTINGLAILNEQPNVAEFYRTDVIGGPGAFVVSADDYRDFGEAIRRKLLRELAPGPVAAAR
jgi:Protein of unknown function (DUF1194)